MARSEYDVPANIAASHPEDTLWWRELVSQSKKQGCLSCAHRLPIENDTTVDPNLAPWHGSQSRVKCAHLAGLVIEEQEKENGNHLQPTFPVLPNESYVSPFLSEIFIKDSCSCWKSEHNYEKKEGSVRKLINKVKLSICNG